jgi:hypothetical protein
MIAVGACWGVCYQLEADIAVYRFGSDGHRVIAILGKDEEGVEKVAGHFARCWAESRKPSMRFGWLKCITARTGENRV